MLKSQCSTRCLNFPGIKWLSILPVLVLLDQASKWLVFDNLSLGEVKPLVPGLQVTLAFNPGVAFSFFNQHEALGHIFLISSISLICGYLFFMLMKTPQTNKLMGFSYALILGGALGNLWDRVSHGFVIDFIDFYVANWHWYTFNFADCFITIGAFLLIFDIFFSKEPLKKA